MKVTIFGYSEAESGDSLYRAAFKTGKLLAQAGFTIVNGAGPGVMRASTQGAHAGDGKVIGITFDSEGMTFFEGQDLENKVDKLIILRTYVERTMKLLEQGNCYVIFNGGTGTLSEFAMAWGLARLYFGNHKPIVFYGSFWHEVIEALAKNMLIREKEKQVYRIVDSPKSALLAVKELLEKSSEIKRL
jgi:uncharacterized protein (TIGR00730 family)